jgi:hypothetical protein
VQPTATPEPAPPTDSDFDCGSLKHGACFVSQKPLYCWNRELKENCGKCGCPEGKDCNFKTGKCVEKPAPTPKPTPTPSQDLDCGLLGNMQCHSEKPLYCLNGALVSDCEECGCRLGEDCNAETGKCFEAKTPVFEIAFKHPVEGQTLIGTNDINSVSVEISEAQGSQIQNKSVSATLTVDGKTQEIELVREENGLYTAELAYSIPLGQHIITISLEDQTTETIKTTIAKQIDLLPFAGFILLLFLSVFLVNYIKNSFKEKTTAEAEKHFEIAKRKRMLNDLRLDFYRRHITEEEYKDKALLIQAELREISEMTSIKQAETTAKNRKQTKNAKKSCATSTKKSLKSKTKGKKDYRSKKVKK